jgi:predicted nucleotidyltransferase
MLTPEKLNIITKEITQSIKNLLGDKLDKVILYGSYARGDYDEYSDLDIMVLADIENDKSWLYRDKLYDTTSELALEHDILITVKIKNNQFFYEHEPIIPYYQNVLGDGIELYVNR